MLNRAIGLRPDSGFRATGLRAQSFGFRSALQVAGRWRPSSEVSRACGFKIGIRAYDSDNL